MLTGAKNGARTIGINKEASSTADTTPAHHNIVLTILQPVQLILAPLRA